MITVKRLLFGLISFIYLLFLLFQRDLAMVGDLGKHLALGKIIVECLCIPQTNLFSYTHPQFQIVNHEWLAEIIYYGISSLFGLKGLLVFKILLILTTASLLYRVALQKGSLFWVNIFSILSITLFSMRFFVLIELFSYLFIALFIFIIESYKKSKKFSLLILLPLLELLWVNMHLFFILGISMYGFFLLETFLRQKKLDKKLLLIGLLLLAATCINPDFIRGALLPFTFSTNYGFNVEENNSPLTILTPNSTNSNMAYTVVLQIIIFELMLCLFIICFFIKKLWREIFSLGNGLAAAVLGVKFTRCISLFGLFSFIPLVQAFTYFEEKLKKTVEIPMLNILKGIIFIGVCLIVFFHIKGLFDYKLISFSFVPSAENAVTFIKQADIHGPFFNNYSMGNYLIYSFYPQEKVYVDPRPEAYPASFFDEYFRMMSDEAFFNDQVKRYSINAVIFNVAFEDPAKSRPFLLRLLQNKEWIPVYGDGTVTIFVRNTERNKAIIDKYKISIN